MFFLVLESKCECDTLSKVRIRDDPRTYVVLVFGANPLLVHALFRKFNVVKLAEHLGFSLVDLNDLVRDANSQF